MGLYTDITNDIVNAFDTTLADAISVINITEFGTSSYNPTTGTTTKSQTVYTTRGVVISLSQEDIRDEPTLKGGVNIIILDTEKQISQFKIGMRIQIDNDERYYKLSYINTDPARITHNLICEKWS